MPEEETIERAREDEREGKSPGTQRENSCAKKWNIFEKEYMVRGRRNRRLPSGFPRQGGQALSCLHPSGAKHEQNGKLNAI